MQLILLIIFAPLLIVGCGKSSGGASEEVADQVGIPERVVPLEISHASRPLERLYISLVFLLSLICDETERYVSN